MVEEDKITVVVPTLGGSQLKKTIELLYSGIVIPTETLICIPKSLISQLPHFNQNSVRVIATNNKGQVPQRLQGFKEAKYDYVMQLDDDVHLEEDCLQLLLLAVKQRTKCAVYPALINRASSNSVYKKKNQSFLRYVYFWLLNGNDGYQPGRIYKSGFPEGVDSKDVSDLMVRTDWMPGGCVLHKKENLFLSNYYPFKGKAYNEDVIHSFFLSNNDINFYLVTGAKCSIEIDGFSSLSVREFVRFVRSDYQSKRYYQKLSGRRSLHIYFYYFVCLVGYILSRSRNSVDQ